LNTIQDLNITFYRKSYNPDNDTWLLYPRTLLSAVVEDGQYDIARELIKRSAPLMVMDAVNPFDPESMRSDLSENKINFLFRKKFNCQIGDYRNFTRALYVALTLLILLFVPKILATALETPAKSKIRREAIQISSW